MRVPETLGEGGRYRIDGEIGRGGMGVVYRALDKNTGQHVAIKVMLDGSNADVLALFDKEWRILAELQHTNIIGINDRGEFRDGPVRCPYFVMPFLRGKSLHEWIAEKNQTATPSEIAAIISAAAAGLQAAHSRGVIHRDVKPSNIFVLDSGSVVVIDFGVVHLGDSQSRTTIKGTTPYMAPELLDSQKHERPSAQSDLFGLGVVCYEALTGVQPFARTTMRDTVRAILHDIPMPAYELNRSVSLLVGQVVQKAMAKDRSHRYKTVTEFADKLQRAVRSEPLPEFDRHSIEDRLRTVRDALARGQATSANEMLRGIEEEGYVDPSITAQRTKIDQALQQNWVRLQLESVRLYRDAKEYVTALEKVNEVLKAVPDHPEALAERDLIDQERLSKALNDARRHMDKRAFSDARRAIEEARQISPRDTQTSELLGELARMEETDRALAEQKETLYQEAQSANREGHLSSALQKLERLMQLIRDSGHSGAERDAIYQRFYEEVLHEHSRVQDAVQRARAYVAEGKLSQALTICDQMLATDPDHPQFKALKLLSENKEREARLDYVQNVCARLTQVPDLERRVALLQEAVTRYPGESQLTELLRNAKSSRDLVNSVIARARKAEELGDFREALDHWQIVELFHASQPGLHPEIQRIEQRVEAQERGARKSVFIGEIGRLLGAGECDRAVSVCASALAEFPVDPELLALQTDAQDQRGRSGEVKDLLAEGQRLLKAGKIDGALDLLRRAHALARRNQQVRQFLGIAVLDKAQSLIESDWVSADQLLQEARNLIPNDPAIKPLESLVGERKQRDTVEACLIKARKRAEAGEPRGAIAEIDECLRVYPNDRRLLESRGQIAAELGDPVPALPVPPRAAAVAVNGSPVGGPPVLDSRPSVVETSVETVFEPIAGTETDGIVSGQTLPPPPPVDETAGTNAKPSSFAVLLNRFQAVDWSAALRRFPKWQMAAGGVALLLLIAFAALALRRPQPQKTPVSTKVQIASTPGAVITVDGKPAGDSTIVAYLLPGNHTAAASLKGYESRSVSIPVDQAPVGVNLELRPLPLRLRIITDQTAGTVVLDQNVQTLENGAIELKDIAPGQHTLKVTGPSESTVSFEFRPGERPIPIDIPKSPATLLFLGSFDGKLTTQCSCPETKFRLGDRDLSVGPGPKELELPEGDYPAVLNVLGGKKLAVTMAAAPAATIGVFWGAKEAPALPPKPDDILTDAENLINNEKYLDAEELVKQLLRQYPDNSRAQGLMRRLDRINSISSYRSR